MKTKYLLLVGMLALVLFIPAVSAAEGVVEYELSTYEQIMDYLGFPVKTAPQHIENHESMIDSGYYLCDMDETSYVYCERENKHKKALFAYSGRMNYWNDGSDSWEVINSNMESSSRLGFDYEVVKGYYQAYFNTEDKEIVIERPTGFYISFEEEGLISIPMTDNDCSEDNEEPTEIDCGNKVLLCQVPPGNDGQRKEICVAEAAVDAHLNTGSYLGYCYDNDDWWTEGDVDCFDENDVTEYLFSDDQIIQNQYRLEGVDYEINYLYGNSQLVQRLILENSNGIEPNSVFATASVITTNADIYVEGELWDETAVSTENEIVLKYAGEDFTLVAPYAFDSREEDIKEGEYCTDVETPSQKDIRYFITKFDGNIVLIKYLDSDWILSEDRVYPVYVDPTTSVAEARSVIVQNSNPREFYEFENNTYYNDNKIESKCSCCYIGGDPDPVTSCQETHAWLAFDLTQLSQEPSTVSSAVWYHYIDRIDYWDPAHVSYHITNWEFWSDYCESANMSTMTWYNQATNCPLTNRTKIEEKTLPLDTLEDTWANWNVTDEVDDDVQLDDSKFIIRLEPKDSTCSALCPTGDSHSYEYRTQVYATEADRPYLMMTYEAEQGSGALTTDCSGGKPVALHLDLLKENELTEDLYGDIRIWLNSTTDWTNYTSQNFTFTNVTEADICLDPANATVYAWGGVEINDYPDYVYENWYFIEYVTLTNVTTNQSLYDLETNDSTSFEYTILDQNYLPVEGAYLTVQRFYPGENQYINVERSQSDAFGKGVVHLIVEDVLYKFTIENSTDTLLITDTAGKAYCTVLPCELPFTVGEPISGIYESYADLDNVLYSVSWDETNKLLTYTWADTSDSFVRAELEIFNGTGYTGDLATKFYQSSASASSTIVANLTNTTTYPPGTYAVDATVNQGSGDAEVRETRGYTITIYDTFSFGLEGLFWASMVILVVFFAFLAKPKVGIIVLPAAMVMLSMMKLINIPFSAVATVVCLAAIIAYAVFR